MERDLIVNLNNRVKAIMLTPYTEWSVIEREARDAWALFIGYVAILAVISAICGFIGMMIADLSVRSAMFYAMGKYLSALVTVYILALVINGLAPSFNGRRNLTRALNLAVYSYTPMWLAGIFLLVPGLSFLEVIGVYGIYLLWLGMHRLMDVPRERAVAFAGAVLVFAIVIAFIANTLIGSFLRLPGFAL